MSPAIETQDLTKTFRPDVVAVSGLDLQVPCGSVYGLIGRNGAGKTTTLRLMLGLLRPERGSARILGEEFGRAPRALRQRVAYVSQGQQLPGWMSLEDLSRYLAPLYDAWDRALAVELARRWGLAWQRPSARLSGGEQRQAAILLALAARPEVLVLDEPAAGLDPVARRALLGGIVEAMTDNPRCTVLLSTHLIGDLERVADHVGMLDRGRLHSAGRLDDLLARTRRVQVVFDAPEAPPGFAIPGAFRTHTVGPVVTALVRLCGEQQLDSVRALGGVRVQWFPVGLEELFLEWFGQPAAERDLSDGPGASNQPGFTLVRAE